MLIGAAGPWRVELDPASGVAAAGFCHEAAKLLARSRARLLMDVAPVVNVAEVLTGQVVLSRCTAEFRFSV
jgi:hypothetical protein